MDPGQTIVALSCPSPTLCVGVDAGGNVVTSADPAGGAGTWTVASIGGGIALNGVSCPSTSLCVAVDNAGNAFTSTDPNGGAGTWNSTGINGGLALHTISCPTVTLCVAGGETNGTVIWSTDPTGGFATWTPVHIDGTNGVFGLSCPTTTLCVSGNDVGDLWTTTNPTGPIGAWTSVPAVDPGDVIEGMSCAGESLCVGVDDLGNVVTSTNPTGGFAAWTVTSIGGGIQWAVACPATTLCLTGAGSQARSSADPAGGAAAWATDSLGTGLFAYACSSETFCVAGGASGNVYIGVQAGLAVSITGAGTGSVSGNSIACPGLCSRAFPLSTAVTLTATPAAGSVFTGWSGACAGTGDCNLTMAADRAVTAAFDLVPPDPPATPASNPPDQDPPPATPAADLPPPVESQTANAYPTAGTVLVQAARSKKFVPLTTPQQVRFGVVFDTRRGAVQLVIDNGHGGFDTATFSEGVFKLVQRGTIAELVLTGGNFKGCPKAAKGGAAALAAAKRGRSVRHLWGSGSGNFRTKGRFAAATIRGTKWLTDDRCFGTLIKVASGAVTVRDFVTKKSRALRAPKSYFAGA